MARQDPAGSAQDETAEDKSAAAAKASRRPTGSANDGGEAKRERVAGQNQGERGKNEGNEADDSAEAEPLLATSPAGLLQPRAAEALQDNLITRGHLEQASRSGKLDGKTRRALREFQREQGIPATGIPDDLTVQKLGLSPDDVFRSTDDRRP